MEALLMMFFVMACFAIGLAALRVLTAICNTPLGRKILKVVGYLIAVVLLVILIAVTSLLVIGTIYLFSG